MGFTFRISGFAQALRRCSRFTLQYKVNDPIGAGTSTPDEVIHEVENWLKDFAEFQAKLAERMNPAVA